MMKHVLRGMMVLVAGFGVLCPRAAIAAPVATGALVLECDYYGNGRCCATITFDDTEFDVFGTTFNLGDAVGTATTIDIQAVQGPGLSGSYTHTSQSFPLPNFLSWEAAGSYVCAGLGPDGFCAPPVSYVGYATNLAGDVDLPAGLSYTEDGTHYGMPPRGAPTVPSCPLGVVRVFEGPFSINAFQPKDTPVCSAGECDPVLSSTTYFNSATGTSVPVEISIKYGEVSSAGETVATAFSNAAGEVPSNFATQVDGQCSNDESTACCADADCPGGTCVGCYRAAFVDISTTAAYSGPIEVCSTYKDDDPDDGYVDGTNLEEIRLRILHEEGGVFVDRTSSRNLGANEICATVDSLSFFVVAAEVYCAAAPQVGCRAAEKSILLIKDKDDDAKDKLLWKWIKGEPTSQAEFGVPTGSAQYALCVYAGTAQALITDPTVPPDPVKWQPISTKGYKYKDKTGAADGVQKMVLKGSTENKSKALLKAKGANIPMPELPLALPVTAQLVNSQTGICWEGVYDTADVKKTTEDQFKAKAQTP